MKYKLSSSDAALASQMDWQQGTVTSRGGVFAAPAIVDGWLTARSNMAVEYLLRRTVDQGPDLYRKLRREDQNGRQRLDRRFHDIGRLLSHACPQLEYSPLLSRMMRIAEELGLKFQPLANPADVWVPADARSAGKLLRQTDAFDELLSRLAEEGREPAAALECRRWRAQAYADFHSATTYVDALLRATPELYVLRMNLGDWGALLANPPSQPVFGDVQDIKARFSRFAKELSRGLPDVIVGYLARLDFGPQKGYFYHVVILLRASEAHWAAHWCEQLGKRWIGLSPEGRGAYTGCNWVFQDPAASIDRIDAEGGPNRVAVERVILSYLTLASLYTRVRLKPRQRVFTRGTLPKVGKTS